MSALREMQAAFRDKGVRVIAYQSDMRRYAPEAQLAAVSVGIVDVVACPETYS